MVIQGFVRKKGSDPAKLSENTASLECQPQNRAKKQCIRCSAHFCFKNCDFSTYRTVFLAASGSLQHTYRTCVESNAALLLSFFFPLLPSVTVRIFHSVQFLSQPLLLYGAIEIVMLLSLSLLTGRKTVARKLQQKINQIFGTSGRSSSTKPSCNRMELDRCTAPQRKTDGTKTKMLEYPRSSPPIASCPTRSRTEEHPF